MPAAEEHLARLLRDDVVVDADRAEHAAGEREARGEQRSLLGVNKGERLQRISFATPATACPRDAATLTLFGPDNQPRPGSLVCQQGQVRFELPGQTLFALNWSAS